MKAIEKQTISYETTRTNTKRKQTISTLVVNSGDPGKAAQLSGCIEPGCAECLSTHYSEQLVTIGETGHRQGDATANN